MLTQYNSVNHICPVTGPTFIQATGLSGPVCFHLHLLSNMHIWKSCWFQPAPGTWECACKSCQLIINHKEPRPIKIVESIQDWSGFLQVWISLTFVFMKVNTHMSRELLKWSPNDHMHFCFHTWACFFTLSFSFGTSIAWLSTPLDWVLCWHLLYLSKTDCVPTSVWDSYEAFTHPDLQTSFGAWKKLVGMQISLKQLGSHTFSNLSILFQHKLHLNTIVKCHLCPELRIKLKKEDFYLNKHTV